ncbi:AAA family ATPase [Bacillus sp. JCM 19034]|uniref:AAA family ATPase n=1 Tax=Bacillus sp. JCM 19034 TaxID=1481928 RepID=UPI000783C0CD|nr:AAA family ATPase [Bacillus sp. JCM 19034]
MVPSWDQKWYDALIKRYEIDSKEKYRNCSTGTKRKVDFILALAHHPAILLLDEPTSGVDLVSQRKMKDDLLRFMEEGMRSILIATHQQEEIKQLSDYICFMNKGQIIDHLEKEQLQERWARIWISSLPKELKQHPNVKQVSEEPFQLVTNDLPGIESVLERLNVQITHRQRLDLDEVMEYYFL